MDPQNLTLPIAFVAGLLSFASPCVLPLVPAYLGYLGGTAVGEQRAPAPPRYGVQGKPIWPFVHALLFVLGFTAVFVALGATATFIGKFLSYYLGLFLRVGGVLLVVLGMRLMGIQKTLKWWIAMAVVGGLITLLLSANDPLQRLEEGLVMVAVILAGAGFARPIQAGLAVAAGLLNLLASYDALVPKMIASVLIMATVYFLSQADLFYAEKRLELKQGRQLGYLRSLLVGVIFAAGWTPCIGPILTGILIVASTLETVGQGILLLTVYSLGLGLPFLLVGLAFAPLSTALRRANRYLGVVSIVSGVLLALMGILIFTDSLGFLAQYGNFFTLEL
jgi:cytochrome c-type biogenesis protein